MAGVPFPGRRMLLALGFMLFAVVPLQAAPVRITFLHVNDVYEIAPKHGQGGLAELMTLLEEERAKAPDSITTFGGDLLSPSVLSGLTKGAQMIEITNEMGFDFAVPGNHEFDFGPDIAAQRIAASHYPWLAANLLTADGKPAVGTRPFALIERGGFRIGLFGLITPETATLSSPGDGIRFAPVRETARRMVERLREEGADFIVALTHLDFATDRRLMEEVEGIDLVLGGHDHDPITFYEGGSLLIKAGYDAHYLAAVDIYLDRVEKRGRMRVVWRPEWRYRSTDGIAPDARIRKLVERWNERLDKELAVPVGETAVELDTRRDTVRTRESNFGDLVADAMRAATGADVALTNGGGIRGNRVYAAGSALTRKDILTELPFGNVTVLVELRGADLLAALENGVSQVEKKAGRFPQISGMRFRYDPALPAGRRVLEVTVAGKPLDPGATYRVATNDYLLKGGDGYDMLRRGLVRIDPSGATLMATTVMDYISAMGGRIAPRVEGRIESVE